MNVELLATLAMVVSSPPLALGRLPPKTAFPSQAVASQLSKTATNQSRGGPVTNGLQVFIEAQRAPIPEGQPIAIVFHVTNLGAVDFDFGWCRSAWEADFLVAVTTDRGEPVSRSGPGLGVVSCMSNRISPGEELVEIGNIRSQYALRPGNYYVTATENFERGDGPPLQATSNTIEITVIPPSEDASSRPLRLVCGVQSIFDPPGYAAEGLRLTNSGDRDIDILSGKQGQPWFHDVSLDLRTLSGSPVPRKRDLEGQEISFEKEGWGLYTHRYVSSGSLRPAEYLDGELLFYRLYQLSPGTAYTLTTQVTLQTSDGPMEVVSNTVTFPSMPK